MAKLGNDMATVTNAVSVIMESMHAVVDGLGSGQEETAALATEQKELKDTLLQFINNSSNNNNPTPDTLQTLTSTVNALHNDITELKSRPTPSPPQPTNHSNLETLLQAQNTRIDRLIREVASLKEQQQQTHASHAPQQQPQHQNAEPQTLRQAMAAAERDLEHHLATVQAFYHRRPGGQGAGVSRAVTERTAELMNLLTEGMRAAREGQAGG
jgi:chromosome segregation ATPase